jgi:hypothetical protein
MSPQSVHHEARAKKAFRYSVVLELAIEGYWAISYLLMLRGGFKTLPPTPSPLASGS